MKFSRKILAILLAAVMIFGIIPLTASAASIESTAKAVTSGKQVTKTLDEHGTVDYKVSISKTGTLKLNINFSAAYFWVEVYDSNGNKVRINNDSISSGSARWDSYLGRTVCGWNDNIEKFNGTLFCNVEKGTYYIRIKWTWDGGYAKSQGTGKLNFTATFPTSTSTSSSSSSSSATTSSKGTISYLTLRLPRGSSIQLGGVVSPTSSKITWTSSNKSVAPVTTSGKVTAKIKGSSIITAKVGTSSQKIKIIVT